MRAGAELGFLDRPNDGVWEELAEEEAAYVGSWLGTGQGGLEGGSCPGRVAEKHTARDATEPGAVHARRRMPRMAGRDVA